MVEAGAEIELWFEFASTYSYLAVHDVEKSDAPVRFRPFLLGPIFAAQGWKDSPFNIYPAKGRYMWRDLERLCAASGLSFRRPSRFPRSGLLAARIALSMEDASVVPEFTRRVCRANFAEDREIGEPSVLDEIAESLGLDGPLLRERAEAPVVKEGLKSQTARAIELGIFGAPTFVVGDELFWGSDRLGQAVAWWRGRAGASAAK